MEIEER